jgi:hypothetical protein
VLHRLGGREKAGVQRGCALVLFHDLLALIENALDGIAFLAACGFAKELEDLVKAFDLAFGFV